MRDQHGIHGLLCRTGTLLVGLALSGGALALDWRTGETVTIGPSEVIRDDLYVAGTDVRIDGTVTGDLIAAGQRVRIAGNVRGDVWAAGGTVTLAGRVGRSARLAGSVLTLEPGTSIARDLLAGGVGLDLAPGARIGRDLAFGGAQTRLNGTVTRNAYLGATAVQLGGTVGGNARLNVDNRASWPQNWTPGMVRPDPLPSGVRFMPGGRVAGDLTLQMPDRPMIPARQVGGQMHYQPTAVLPTPRVGVPRPPANPLGLNLLRDFAGLSLMALLLVGLARTPLSEVSLRLRRAPGTSLGYGTLIALGFPLGVLALFGVGVTLAALLTLLGLGALGLPLGLIGAPTLLGLGALVMWLGWWVAQGLAAVLLGQWLLGALAPERRPALWIRVLLGALTLAALTQLPVLGTLVTLGALLAALGATWLWWRPPPSRVGPLFTPYPA
ncbi:bactofilin family protein [Deinococcus koreensis]|uniref:Polymer-forming cytoskeletal protein n=1 Tax=Deinococcus koreensis TaxID=2054903 RepID=A0A2K3USR3_9DEIO|nr:polymer-forming cytoskeletal protein [Deinococcus koreensis]PNY79557.1 hypothetical protein CVO96_19220 [Deinococcus koreensis]